MLLALVVDYHTVGRYAYVLYAISFTPLPCHGGADRHGRSTGLQSALYFSRLSSPSSLTLALARYFAEDPKRGRLRLGTWPSRGMVMFRW
jgi:hypothetical protein